MLSLRKLNQQLAQALQTIHDEPKPYIAGDRMAECVHQLDFPKRKVTSHYCGSQFCLLCRRRHAATQRGLLRNQLAAAKADMNCPSMCLFLTCTLIDVEPDGVQAHATALVEGFEKLRRKLKGLKGWTRVIEVKRAFNPELENIHMHALLLFPAAWKEEMHAFDWHEQWKRCAGATARDVLPKVVYKERGIITYINKSADSDFMEDGQIGIEDPRRYVQRIVTGRNKFSSGGALRFRLSSAFDDMDRLTGLADVITLSMIRTSAGRAPRERIPVDDGK